MVRPKRFELLTPRFAVQNISSLHLTLKYDES